MTSLLLFVAGCGGGVGVSPQPTWATWARNAGGVVHGPEQASADRALSRLGINASSPVVVRVLLSDSLGAWTFADGNIFVSRGLVRALNDDELAGVLAHETGHLRAAGQLPAGAAFDGATASARCEERADDLGRILLESRGIPPFALISALKKVRNAPSTSALLRAALDGRIRRQTLESGPMPAGRELLMNVSIAH